MTHSHIEIVQSLEDFFASIKISDKPIRLDDHTYIESPAQFVDAHLAMSKNNRSSIAEPYIERLQKYRDLLTELSTNDTDKD